MDDPITLAYHGPDTIYPNFLKTRPHRRLYGNVTRSMYVAAFGAPEELVQCADINNESRSGWTALKIAVANDNLQMCERLIKCGARADIQNTNLQTVLFTAVQYFASIPIIRLLLNNGCGINDSDSNGWAVLMWACIQSNNPNTLEIVKTLVDAGADINKHCPQTVNGVRTVYYSPLIVASKYDKIGLCSFLIKRGAKLDFILYRHFVNAHLYCNVFTLFLNDITPSRRCRPPMKILPLIARVVKLL